MLALHPYDEVIRRFLLVAKNGGRRDLLRLFGQQLARTVADDAALSAGWLEKDPTVVWVPASRDKRRRRGYDQGRVLARSAGGALGLPVVPVLTRAGGECQEGRGRTERLRGPTLRSRLRTAPPHVLLVDDVITTGSSLAAAATALRSAGSDTIVGIAVASSDQGRSRLTLAPAPFGGLW